MKHRRRHSKAKILVISILVLAGIFLLAPKSDFIESYSVGDAFQLTLTPNYLIKCEIQDKMQVKYADGRVVEVNSAYDSFNPLISYDLVQRHSREQITAFPSDIILNCAASGATSGGFSTTVSGSIAVIAQATAPDGSKKTFLSKTLQVSERNLRDGVNLKLPSYFLKQADIDNVLPNGNGDYTSWITVHSAPFLTFKIKQGSDIVSTSTYSGKDLQTNYLVRVLKDAPPPTQAALGTEVNIVTYTPKTIQLPIQSNQGFITINGQSDNWSTGEGFPWIKLVSPNGVESNKIRFTSYSNSNNDKWTEFKLTFKAPASLTEGTWDIKMGSDQPNRGQSIRSITVIPEPTPDDPTPPPTTDTNVDPDPVDDTPTDNNGITKVKMQYKYQLIYDGAIREGLQPEEGGLPITLTSLKLVDDDGRTGLKPLVQVKVEVLGIPDKTFTPLSNDFIVTGEIDIGDKTIPLSQLDFVVTKVNTRDSSNNIHFSAIEIQPRDIESRLKAEVGEPTVANQRIDVRINVDGNFKGTDVSGNPLQGSVDGSFYQFTTFYGLVEPAGGTDPTNPTDPTDPVPTSGGDDGEITIIDDVFEIVDDIGGIISDGVTGSSGTVTTCVDEVCTTTDDTTTETDNTMLYIIIGAVVLLLIVVIARRR